MTMKTRSHSASDSATGTTAPPPPSRLRSGVALAARTNAAGVNMRSLALHGMLAIVLPILAGACSSNSTPSHPSNGQGGAPGAGGSMAAGGSAGASVGSAASGGGAGSSGAATGGRSGSGGQTGTSTPPGGSGGAASCSSAAKSCGGDVTGAWSVASSCLTVSGQIDMTTFGLGCSDATVLGSLQVTGSWTGAAEGTYTDATTTSGNEQLTLPASCLQVSGTTTTCDKLSPTIGGALGYASVTCTAASGGGCSCTAKVQQSGGIGLLSADPQTSGNYTTAGNVLTADDGPQYAYCVSGNTMVWAPQSPTLTVTGSITLQKSGTGAGSGGQGGGGRGGTVAAGGAGGAAGGSAAGGTTPSGGSKASGGSSGSSSAGGAPGVGGAGGSTGGTSPSGSAPCDVYQAANTPCVGAYSTVRALFASYNGPLYQVRRTSDKTTKDIPMLAAGGYVDASVQDTFCGTGACTISVLYDQSPQKNDLPVSGKALWLTNGGTESDAKAVKISAGGHPAYGVKFVSGKGNSYRNNSPKGTATGDQAEAMYEVVDSKNYNGSCCNDFGNAETNGQPKGAATMEAIYWGNCTLFGGGSGNGPWLLADLEAGTFASSKATDTNNTPLVTPAFATLVLKGFAGNRFAMKGGDAQAGSLTTKWDGARPGGYSPMKKEGAIVLGTGGDGSDYSNGTFFEGAITSGCPDSNSVDDAIQANVVSAGYGK